VSGVAVLQGVIYTVCKDSETIQSYKFDKFFTRQRDIPVSGLQDACDIVACARRHRLYVAEQQGIWVISTSSHNVRLCIVLTPLQAFFSFIVVVVFLVSLSSHHFFSPAFPPHFCDALFLIFVYCNLFRFVSVIIHDLQVTFPPLMSAFK